LASTTAARTPGAWLHAAAERLLREAKSGGADRTTALTLLAADALATYACEWTAEHSVEDLGQPA
jgi:hypothetical protein